jgi:hypothetical protein
MARHDEARPGPAWQSPAWLGKAWLGEARQGKGRLQDPEQNLHGFTWRGPEKRGQARRRLGGAWQGKVNLGAARQGGSRRSVARRSGARRSGARQQRGRATSTKRASNMKLKKYSGDMIKREPWQRIVPWLLANRIEGGEIIACEQLEDLFGYKFTDRNAVYVVFQMYQVRIALERSGFALVQDGKDYRVLPKRENVRVCARKLRLATNLVRRTVILLEATDTSDFDPADLARHKAMLERAQIRRALMDRQNDDHDDDKD